MLDARYVARVAVNNIKKWREYLPRDISGMIAEWKCNILLRYNWREKVSETQMSCTMRLLQDFKEGKRLIIFSIEKLIVVEYIL